MNAQLKQILEGLRQDLEDLSSFIYHHPETAYEEHEGAKAHVTLLKKHGFQVQMPYLGIATAFRATFAAKEAGRTVAFLSEYDALPGLGHGCGHNLLGATTTLSGIALSKIMTKGQVVVIGTPGEETSGAKVDMAEADTFDDIDAVFCTHPEDRWVESGSSLALEAHEFRFKGKTAHAASHPDEAINALDAIIALFNATGALRQQTRTTARITGIITEGGLACNLIPDNCACRFYIRAEDMAYMKVLSKRLMACAQAAALQTGCTLEHKLFEKPYHNLVTNSPLNQRVNTYMKVMGITMHKADRPIGSLDIGNVSQKVPVVNPYFDITQGVPTPGHTPEFRDASLTAYAVDSALKIANGLILTALDVIHYDTFFDLIRKDFEQQHLK